MAVSKVKRSIHLTQPQPERHRHNIKQEPTEQMPVRAHVYRTIAEMNDGFEHAVAGLETLIKIHYLRSDSLAGIQNLISRVRADANRELITVLHEREAVNARHFEQRCSIPDGNPQPPAADR